VRRRGPFNDVPELVGADDATTIVKDILRINAAAYCII